MGGFNYKDSPNLPNLTPPLNYWLLGPNFGPPLIAIDLKPNARQLKSGKFKSKSGMFLRSHIAFCCHSAFMLMALLSFCFHIAPLSLLYFILRTGRRLQSRQKC